MYGTTFRLLSVTNCWRQNRACCILSWCRSQSSVRLISRLFLLTFYLKRIKTSVIELRLLHGLRDARILHMYESYLMMSDLNLKTFNRVFAPFLELEFHEEFVCCTHMDCTNYFSACRVGVRDGFWIFKQDFLQIVCFVRYPISLFSAIVKPTENKHTNIEISVAQKYSVRYRDSHHSNSQLSTTSQDTLYSFIYSCDQNWKFWLAHLSRILLSAT